jgi:hypothetical protein
LTQCGSATTTRALTTLRGQGAKGSQGCHQKVKPLAGCYLTELMEPCGALPRKCLFIHLFTRSQVKPGSITDTISESICHYQSRPSLKLPHSSAHNFTPLLHVSRLETIISKQNSHTNVPGIFFSPKNCPTPDTTGSLPHFLPFLLPESIPCLGHFGHRTSTGHPLYG